MYFPFSWNAPQMSQRQAEEFMNIIDNSGWIYVHHGESSKFAMAITKDFDQELGQKLVIASPSIIHTITIATVKTWNKNITGEANV